MSAVADLDEMLTDYIVCALWSTTCEDGDGDTSPLDDWATADDLAPETRAEMAADCAGFVAILAAECPDSHAAVLANPGQAGHDFWLTRNGHGAGFWDRGTFWPNDGRGLTKWAKTFGSVDLYVGDDGKIHS